MRILARERALDIISEENCVKVLGDLYLCGLDYLLVKRFVIASIADDAFGFVGDYVPILDVKCDKYLMYYGVPKVLFNDKLMIPGWKIAESENSIIVHSCIEDDMEFFEAEEFVFLRVPLSMFGFGSVELYGDLVDLLKKKTLYMVRFLY